jgi:hypothetical protein
LHEAFISFIALTFFNFIQRINTRLLDAEGYASQSQSARIANRASKSRTSTQPPQKDSDLTDKATRRSRDYTRNQFHRSSTAIAPPSDVDSSSWRFSNNLLVEMYENNTQTVTTATIFASHGAQEQAEEILYRLMKSRLGNNVLKHLSDEQDSEDAVEHIYNAEFKDHYLTTTKKNTAATVSPPSESLPALPLVMDAPDGVNAGGSADDIGDLMQELVV